MNTEFISADKTHDLRRKILREGRADAVVHFDGDDDPESLHLGVYQNDHLIGILTALPKPLGTRTGGWQIRGMAVDSNIQKSGAGRALVDRIVHELRKRQVVYVWCNARSSARGFYEKLGFHIVSDEFTIESVGPHFKMTRDLNS